MGNLIKATGAAFNMDDMFYNFPYEKLNLTCKDCQELNNNKSRQEFVKKIFREHFKKVIEDIIDNNVTFNLPLNGGKKADIHMDRIQGDKFKNLFRHGKWRDVDFLKSMFTGYQLSLFMYGVMKPRIKPIHLNKRLKDKITEYTNNGKQYC